MSDQYTAAFALFGVYATVTLGLPRFGGSLSLVSRFPRLTVALWLGGLAVAISSLTVALGLLIANSLNESTTLWHGEPWQAAVAQNVLGWTALACTGVVTFHLASAGQWLRAERADYARQAGAVISHSRLSKWGDDVREVPLDRHLISAFPQTGTILISDFSNRTLSADEMAAAIAHERAHLAGKHAFIVSLTQLAMAAAVGVDTSRRFARTVKLAVEFTADDVASAGSRTTALADAIRATAEPNDPLAELRLRRLTD